MAINNGKLFSFPIGFPRSFCASFEDTNHIDKDETAEFYCQYRSKRCWNMRARKQSGAMHRLCEFHRDRANANQRRLEQRRRASRGAQPVTQSMYSSNFQHDLKLMREILATPACSPITFKMSSPSAVTFHWSELTSTTDSGPGCVVIPAESRSTAVASPVDVNATLISFASDAELLESQGYII